MDRNTEIHATGKRLLALRAKLRAREGSPGFEKNCRELRIEIARLEQVPAPTEPEMDAAWKAAEDAKSTASDEDATPSGTATGMMAPRGGFDD